MHSNTCCSTRKQFRLSLKSGLIIRKGRFKRKSGARPQKYLCKVCGRNLSSATYSWNYYQKKRHINTTVRRMLLSNVSMNRTAKIVGTKPEAIALRLKQLSEFCTLRNERNLNRAFQGKRAMRIQFDELETFEKTKLVPLNVAVAVTDQRLILGFEVCSMPPHPLYHTRSLAKYGVLPDERPIAIRRLLKKIKSRVHDFCEAASDCCPRYLEPFRTLYPGAKHKTHYARQAKPSGFGELKYGAFDPLFAINHTLAMLRANVNRLNRRTWCTTKKRSCLMAHLAIYIESHNRYVLNLLANRDQALTVS